MTADSLLLYMAWPFNTNINENVQPPFMNLCNNNDETLFSMHKHLLGLSGEGENLGLHPPVLKSPWCLVNVNA